ncbi:histidine kinase [Lentzea sp. BCCO 10_0856]|uniref:histidine kinase n=1 Tax=Lentzea miocenica TaxID=3095431 RepID=A0ABU4TB48_9PSEU|nr:histidine kinase [Lentzea sp. BCCO 10_0856]MDX8035402.1 histidine kinase [Lentzea sp. BCCO 10_0856]
MTSWNSAWPVVARWAPRFAPLALVVASTLWLAVPAPDMSLSAWIVPLTSSLLFVVGRLSPLPVSLAQHLLVLTAFLMAAPGVGAAQACAALSLGELAMRRPWLPQLLIGCATALAVDTIYLVAQDDQPVLVALRVALVVGVPVLAGRHLRSMRELTARQSEEKALILRVRDAEISAAREADRVAVARELHDLVAHHVSSMVLRSAVARHAATGPEQLREVLDDVHATGSAALRDLRELVTVLRDPSVPSAVGTSPDCLTTAVRQAAASCERAGFAVRTDISESAEHLDASRRLVVLRIVQESLTNVMRHAEPGAAVLLRVRESTAGLDIEVSDAGATPPRPAPDGHGITGMAERVERLGGSFHAGPTGHGWSVRASLPRQEQPA